MPRFSSAPLRCDVFCNVIDNFGDAGVCWRLVCELAKITAWDIRLIIDQPGLIDRLRSIDQTTPEVVTWGKNIDSAEIADIVIEAFGCRLPDAYLMKMRQKTKPPAWINLEYLSAEPWIDGCHGLPSPDPQSGIAKYFFFPGFSPKSGGLIREKHVDRTMAEMREPEYRSTWLASVGVAPIETSCLVSLFCYSESPFDQLFRAFRNTPKPVQCLLAAGLPEVNLQKIKASAALAGVRITQLPFLPQREYDRLLAACDVNFVRGEDSFVRAQYACQPFIWQAYRQQENTHHEKLAAFLSRYLYEMPTTAKNAVRSLHEAWNGGEWHESLWPNFLLHRQEIVRHNILWAQALAKNGNLAENLAAFCQSKL